MQSHHDPATVASGCNASVLVSGPLSLSLSLRPSLSRSRAQLCGEIEMAASPSLIVWQRGDQQDALHAELVDQPLYLLQPICMQHNHGHAERHRETVTQRDTFSMRVLLKVFQCASVCFVCVCSHTCWNAWLAPRLRNATDPVRYCRAQVCHS
jgi:hypothetical protein